MPSCSALFSPLTLRQTTLANRVVISPMCQYSAQDGLANEWHLVHLGKLAQGGAGMIISEAVAVDPDGRISHGDLGIWSEAHAEALAPITAFISRLGSVPAIQLAHAGRKASIQRPWDGNGPLNKTDIARGETPWETIAPTALPQDEGWLIPRQMSAADISGVISDFARAAERAHRAGFEVAEVHAAHGYLIASFLSAYSNHRQDGYGGDRLGRSRMLLETVEAVRASWPKEKPLLVRLSAVDGSSRGWTLEESIALATDLKALGVDLIDCSSGGVMGPASTAKTPPPAPGFQVPYAEAIREGAAIPTLAVGLILSASQAERIIADGQADLVAIGREALYNPNWPLHAAQSLGIDPQWEQWPPQYGWSLSRRVLA